MGKINMEESTAPVVRNYKDTMFRLLFKDKRNLLSLYNAVNNTHYENADELEIVTLENAVFMNMKNDLAFVMDFYLNIYEHQSTLCPNMPLRDLFYVSKEYSKLVDSEKLYGSKLVKIPTPQFYVFYNGEKNAPESQILCLSDAFEQSTDAPELELKVRMLNINTGKNKKLLDRCGALREYMLFVEKVRKYSETMVLEDAVRRAVDECIAEGILKEFLMKHKQEAIEVCIFEYNEEKALGYIRQDEYDRGKEEGREEGERIGREEGERVGREEGERIGREEGERIGQEENRRNVILNMLKDGLSDEKICMYASCSQELLEEIKKSR